VAPGLPQLEPRCVPTLWYGGEVWVGTRAVHVFEDWYGPVDALRVGEAVYVGAGPGGGPRVAVLDARTGERIAPDYFAGSPTDRSGVVFVQARTDRHEPTERLVYVDRPVEVRVEVPVEVPAPIPEITVGDTDHPNPFTIYVDWDRPPSLDWVTKGMARLAANLPVPGLAFTTVRPDDWPGLYGTAVVSDHLNYADAQYGASVGGLAFADWTDRPNYGVNEFVQVGYEHSTAELFGDLLAHEISHGFGWLHEHGDFRDNLDLIAHGVELAKQTNVS
jgi:hypothetical protein